MIKTGVHKRDSHFWNKRFDALYGQIGANRNARMFNRGLMLESVLYSLGEQERWRYKKRPDEITSQDVATLPTSDWRNSKLLFHLIQTMVTLISDQKLMPSVNGIDALARAFHQDNDRRMKLAMLLKQTGGAYEEVAAQVGMSPEEVPVTNEGLAVRLSMKPQLREEMDFELGISKLLNIYNWEQLDLETIKASLITNITGICIDLDSCMPNIRAINPMNAYCDHSNMEDCSDISEACEIILVPLWKLEAYAKDQFEDWSVVKAQARTYDSIVNMAGFGNYQFLGGYDSTVLYVPVLHGSWVETRNVVYKKIRTKSGAEETVLDIDMDPDKDDRVLEAVSKPYQFVFTGKRIINTEEYYDRGLLEPQMRYLPISNPDEKAVVDPRTSRLNFLFSNPNVIFGRAQSMIDKLKPEMDSLQRAIDKYNGTLQAYIPQAIEIHMDKLADIKIGGEAKSIPQIIAMFERRGILLKQYATSFVKRPNDTDDAIKVHENNMSQNIERLANAWQFLENKVLALAGIAPTELGQSAGNRVSQGLNQSMIQGQNNILGCYYRCRNSTFARVTFQLLLWLQYKGDSGVHDGKEYTIDKAAMRDRLFNTETMVLPTQAQWEALQAEAAKAYDKGIIDWSDLMIIQMDQRKNYKQLSAYFGERERVGRARQDAREEKMIELNNQGAEQAANRKGQMDIQKIQVKENLVNQRSALETQAGGMETEAKVNQLTEAEYLNALVQVNPQAADAYVKAKLGIAPDAYQENVDALVDIVVNPPKKETVSSN